ncbi:hypothetical protein MTR_3g032140 [Medicago truncatula]|uniref:Disease resistance N-terminal domain-containing protein n=1 Tax=Medicago truncatula TaxID=3880 RepID=G7IWZ4_MEDTR|nr:hypothetical protein MTR_3g032140 [Medicago truncatula]
MLNLQAVLDDAKEKQISNPHVKQWLDNLKDVFFDAEDLLQTLDIRDCRCLDSIFILESPSCRSSSLQPLKIKSHKAIGLFKVKLKTLTALEQSLPTTLSRLVIEKDGDIVNTLVKEPLLTISLVSLNIGDLYNMKSFDGNGLQHLSFLEIFTFVIVNNLSHFLKIAFLPR